MAFRMKTIAQLLGIDEQLSVFGRPVFVKDLEGGVKAEANRDGTTFIDKDIPKNEIKEAIVHENVHHDQMQQGRLGYDNKNVYWKEDTSSPLEIHPRALMEEGKGSLDWEGEAYDESNKVKNKKNGKRKK
jgi:hypothetical protein